MAHVFDNGDIIVFDGAPGFQAFWRWQTVYSGFVYTNCRIF
jgi:hypothetical protein